jgi:hypothetical protein
LTNPRGLAFDSAAIFTWRLPNPIRLRNSPLMAPSRSLPALD